MVIVQAGDRDQRLRPRTPGTHRGPGYSRADARRSCAGPVAGRIPTRLLPGPEASNPFFWLTLINLRLAQHFFAVKEGSRANRQSAREDHEEAYPQD